MSDSFMFTNLKEVVGQLEEQLSGLHGELQKAADPHIEALKLLGMSQMGWTMKSYDDGAFKVWNDLLADGDDSEETLHHLAIMHHSRAIDLEASTSPRTADDDWTIALEYWGRLWRSDAFWKRLENIACKGTKPDSVIELRQRMPVKLIRINYDIAFNDKTPNHRRNFHLQCIKDAPFDRAHKREAQRETYTKNSQDNIDTRVWQAGASIESVQEGIDVVETYLQIDPTCVAALEQALILQNQLVHNWVTKFNASQDDQAELTRVMNQFSRAATTWKEYFKQLDDEPELQEATASKLCHWYRIMGDAHARLLDKFKVARDMYKLGAAVQYGDDDDRKSCEEGIADVGKRQSIKKARSFMEAKKPEKALPLLDEVLEGNPADDFALFLRCNCFILLENFADAQRDVKELRKYDSDAADRMQQQLDDMMERHGVQEQLDEATGHMENKQYAKARKVLDKALRENADNAVAYFYRAQCCLEAENVTQAQSDIRAARKHTEETQLLEAIGRLESYVTDLEKGVRFDGSV